jgi:protein-disulfide isomerase
MTKHFELRAVVSSLAFCLISSWAPAPARAQAGEQPVAVVNGRRITQEEVDDSILPQLLPLRRQLYELRKRALENLIYRAILEAEAKKRGVTVEELRRQLTDVKVAVSPGEMEKLYEENASALAAMSPDEARERIRLDLEDQARMRHYRDAVAKLREGAAVEIRLEEPRLPVTGGGAAFTRGPVRAPVTVVEFSDFQCPYCRSVQPALKQVVEGYGDKVRLIFKHLPLTDLHPRAMPAALAAFCAGEQDAFWRYHDALFDSDDLSHEWLGKTAARLGLNLPRFESCLDSEKARSAVLGDAREARRLGINATPAFVINGKLLSGAVSFEEFKRVIDRELKSPPKTPVSP